MPLIRLMEPIMFVKETFNAYFDNQLSALDGAEKITKAVLLDLSRQILTAHHETQDIGYINRLLAVLTPVNRKVANLYFSEFSGFNFNAKAGEFGKKDKKNYEEAKQRAITFLDDPMNNIWSWAGRNVEVEAKEFDEARLKKAMEATLKKADKAGMSQKQVLKALLEGGLTIDTLMEVMDDITAQIEAK